MTRKQFNSRWRRAAVALFDLASACVAVLCLPYGAGPVPVYAQPKAEAEYVDPSLCAKCHADIAATFRQTGMGRSFHRVNASDQTEGFTKHNTLYNGASDRYYTMLERDGRLYEQRYQIGFEGQQTNRIERQIDYVVGSGDHARTYLHLTAEGKLIELPVTWYSELGGYWEMSPGYDRPEQSDFRRSIAYQCMFCHNAYPPLKSQALVSEDHETFGDTIPEGIDCQRCHGPGSAHVKAADSPDESPEAIRNSIVNPGRLTRERQMDICMQCHLETSSSPLPHSILKIDRGVFSYRPGEPLPDYELSFDHKAGTGFDDRMEVAQQAYRLRKSACFLKSRMTCITCHDPHQELTGREATMHYVAVCVGCHSTAHSSEKPEARYRTTNLENGEPNCLTCHMWKRRTDDAIHVVMIDHYIQRLKPSRDLMAPMKEAAVSYRGEVVLYYPNSISPVADADLYLALAQTEDASNLTAGIAQMEQALENDKPRDPQFYFALGAAYSISRQYEKAVPWYEEALRHRAEYPPALRALAATLAAAGDLTRAAAAGERAAAVLPSDTSVLTTLGDVYLRQGNIDKAKAVLQRALAINPDMPEATVYLGMATVREGNLTAGASLFRAAINLQPDLAAAHNDLASILAHQGLYKEAEFHLEKAVAINPADAQVRHNYGMLLARTGPADRALVELKEAVRLEPETVRLRLDLGNLLMSTGDTRQAEREFRAVIARDSENGEAHLGLGALLSRDGREAEARADYEIAARSPDPKVRQAALSALTR
jgi:tetratricopeptide (TPR) repeat protein